MRLTVQRVLAEARRLLEAGKADLDAASALYAEADRLHARGLQRVAVVTRVAEAHEARPVRH